MTLHAIFQLAGLLTVIWALAWPLGRFMAGVYGGQYLRLERWFGSIEQYCYRIFGIDPEEEMTWKTYAICILCLTFGGIALLFAILMLQSYLPLNPQSLPAPSPLLALNTAVSFVTNTNWQSYAGENTFSHFSQMAGLTVQNFLSAAIGMAVAVAFFRGLAREKTDRIGNAWVDITRGTLYILLPLSLLWAILLGSQGVVQTLEASMEYQALDRVLGIRDPGLETTSQSLIPMGPVASQLAIKQLGTNGGGFFNANSAHPFENPTPFANFLELIAILLIPAAFCHTYGAMIQDKRQGWMLLTVMTLIFIPLTLGVIMIEQAGNPLLAPLGVDQEASDLQPGGNMEGKELRHGIASSSLWAAATTAASSGSVNAAHSSLTPLGGLVPLLFMQFGEVIFGGVGSGMYGMLVYVLVTVFIAGLMVGRTPEYLGKKLGAWEIKMASLALLIPPLLVLLATALAVMMEPALSAATSPGAQGFSEVLYAFTSAANNNGSAFGALNANLDFYHWLLALAMLLGRLGVMLPVLAIAGALASKAGIPVSSGTLPTHTPLFAVMLACIIILIGVLSFVPALALGPVAEHLHLLQLSGAGQ